jgi:putative iron-only hydrogenase system regulator
MNRVAVISAILESPDVCQQNFNSVISSFKGIVKGRMGIPLQAEDLAIVSIVIIGELDDINSLTGKLGNIPHVTVKTSISKKEV